MDRVPKHGSRVCSRLSPSCKCQTRKICLFRLNESLICTKQTQIAPSPVKHDLHGDAHAARPYLQDSVNIRLQVFNLASPVLHRAVWYQPILQLHPPLLDHLSLAPKKSRNMGQHNKTSCLCVKQRPTHNWHLWATLHHVSPSAAEPSSAGAQRSRPSRRELSNAVGASR